MKISFALASLAAGCQTVFTCFFQFLGNPFSMFAGPISNAVNGLFGSIRYKRNSVKPGNVEKFDALLNECLDDAFLDIGLDMNLEAFLDYMSICEKKVLATVAGQVKTYRKK